jgi:hypothetical protein
MNFSTLARIFLSLALLINPLAAFETDQYDLPPAPLGDIGDELTDYVEANLKKAVEKVNAEILESSVCLESDQKSRRESCDSIEKEKIRLAYLQSDEAIAKELYELLGTGIPPLTRSGSWVESHRFAAQPARYKTDFGKSIFAVVPTNYLTISSTINVYGSQFGTDKIAHIFQQGYTYYRIYNNALKKKLSREAALRKAIGWGRTSERTFYGTWVSGVYSNADLCANLIGMRFYQGLTREIIIGETRRPPVLQLENGVWKFDEAASLHQVLIKPFISDHLNEALNPSIFTKAFGIRAFVRKTVRKQSCRQWFARFPHLSQVELNKTTDALKLWNSEDYGHKESANFITISNTCFDAGGKFIEAGK